VRRALVSRSHPATSGRRGGGRSAEYHWKLQRTVVPTCLCQCECNPGSSPCIACLLRRPMRRSVFPARSNGPVPISSSAALIDKHLDGWSVSPAVVPGNRSPARTHPTSIPGTPSGVMLLNEPSHGWDAWSTHSLHSWLTRQHRETSRGEDGASRWRLEIRQECSCARFGGHGHGDGIPDGVMQIVGDGRYHGNLG
jgi:hypothetical protein